MSGGGGAKSRQRIALTLVELQQMLALLSAINVREKTKWFVHL
jgi:hypothetical protein